MAAIGENKRVRALFEVNRLLMDQRPEMPISIVNTLLGCFLWKHSEDQPGTPITILELSEKIGLPYTTVSRHLRYLGEEERTGVPGLGLVETEVYLLNRRQKTVKLTHKGRALMDRLRYILGDQDDNQTEGEVMAS